MPTPGLTPQQGRAEDTLNERWREIGFDALLPEEQQYIAIYWLIAETMNGGLHQYFYNSSGDLAPLAMKGLKAVGAIASLGILERALAIFPPGGYSTERENRWKGLKAISGDSHAEIAAFDEVSDALQDYPEDVDGLSLNRLAALYSSNGVWPEVAPKHAEPDAAADGGGI
jgi:hypothetical protein